MKKAMLGYLLVGLVGCLGAGIAGVKFHTANLETEIVKAETETASWVLAGAYTNGSELGAVEDNDVKFTPSKGSNSSAPKYYTTGNAGRFYAGNTLTIESLGGFAITQVDFSVVSSGSTYSISDCSSNMGKISGNSIIISAEEKATDLIWTVAPGESSGQIRISKIVVTLQSESLTLPSFTVTVNQTEFAEGETLSLDDFNVQGSLSNGAAVSMDDFDIKVGIDFDDLGFVSDDSFVFDKTPLQADSHNAIEFTSLYPSETGGTTYLSQIINFSVLAPTDIVLNGSLEYSSYTLDEPIDLSGLRVVAMPTGSDVTDAATIKIDGQAFTEKGMTSIEVSAEWNGLKTAGQYGISVEPVYCDRLTLEDTNASDGSSTYKTFSGVVKHSGTKYAGSSAGSYSSIQLSPTVEGSGIVSTATNGLIRKISIDWNSHCTSRASLDIYAANIALASPSNLQNDGIDKIGSLNFGDSQFIVDGDYAFVGIRAVDAVCYLNKVDFTWEPYGERELSSIEIIGNLTKTSYYEGDSFSAEGLSLKCFYSDGRSIIIDSDFEIEFDTPTAVAGDPDVMVIASYGGLTTSRTFDVNVQNKAVNYSYVFGRGDFDDGFLDANGVYWNYYQDSSYLGYDVNKGIQLGSSKDALKSASLYSYFITDDGGANVSSITVNASTASSGDATLEIYLNGNKEGSFELTSSAKDYTVNGLKGFGVVEFRLINRASKAVYLKSMSINCYTDHVGSVLVPLASKLSTFDSCNLAGNEFEEFKNENDNVIDDYRSELESLMILDKASQATNGNKNTYYAFITKYDYCVNALQSGAQYFETSGLHETDNLSYGIVGIIGFASGLAVLGYTAYKKRDAA